MTTDRTTLTLSEAKAIKYLTSIGIGQGETFPLRANYYPTGVTAALTRLAERNVIRRVPNATDGSGNAIYQFTDETRAAYDDWYVTKGWKLPTEKLLYR